MIEETAQVVAIEEGFAWVETQRKTACGTCAANKGCGTAVLSKVLGRRSSRVRAINHAGAVVGDTVMIAISEQALVRGSLAVYTMPLLFLILAALLGEGLGGAYGFGSSDAFSIAFGLGGLLIGFAWLRRFTLRVERDPRYQPVVLRRLLGAGSSENRALIL